MQSKYISKSIFALTVVFVITQGCKKDYLDVPASGFLSSSTLATKAGVEGLLIGAYSLLDGQGSNSNINNNSWSSSSNNWIFGSIPGGDAHKGSEPGDILSITAIETWSTLPSNEQLNFIWGHRFDGVQRSNEVIRVMRQVKDYTPADTTQITAEARFLRAHFYFDLRKIFKNVPWIGEDISYSAGNYMVPNDVDIFPNIEADFSYAFANLPATQPQVGRANKWAAASYLAKVYLFEKKFSEARTLLTQIISEGQTSNGLKYALVPKFNDNFNAAAKNNSESIFSVQMSVNDGSFGQNANGGDILNFPYGAGPAQCCGFFQPSFSLVNSFKVDANGLPFLDGTFNDVDLKNDNGILFDQPYSPDSTTPVDPRLDWTVGRRGIPYLDWGLMAGSSWIRSQVTSGPYVAVKNAYYQSQEGVLTDKSAWSTGYTAINYVTIRFSDLLLWAAEAEVEGGGTLAQATSYVNMVRSRAADPSGFVQGSVANYEIGLYPLFPTPDYARRAIQFERKLELAMEGHRFFDLVRWGIAEAELNAYAEHEAASKIPAMNGAKFTVGKSEYLPIPQKEIDLSIINGASVLQQNPGY